MISTTNEYYENLWRIQSENPPSIAVLIPDTETIYEIDLNKRIIQSPEYLSVQQDHNAETVFFKIDRFFDNVDLSTTVCVVQYINAAGVHRLYAVPFYDISTYGKENKMIFPWCIEGGATEVAGEVQYSIRFYKISENGDYLTYNLSTLPAKSKVLYGINIHIEDENDEYILTPSILDEIHSRIDQISRYDLYWEEL